MKLFYTDDTFKVHNKTYPGIPFLIDEEMALVDAPNSFLRYTAIIKGRTQSPKTWKTYGNHLYEFFCYLEENGFQWDNINQSYFASWREAILNSMFVPIFRNIG